MRCILIFYFFWALANVVVAVICWHERHCDVLHGIHSPLIAFCFTWRSFWLSLIVFVPISYLSKVFLRKTLTGVTLNTFPNLLLIFNICKCLLMISLIFCKIGLYASKNEVTFLLLHQFCLTELISLNLSIPRRSWLRV